MTEAQLNVTRNIITNAITTLIDNLTNQEFVSTYVEQLKTGANAVNRFKYRESDAVSETTVYLMYRPDILSSQLIIPRRPGAIVNNYNIVSF